MQGHAPALLPIVIMGIVLCLASIPVAHTVIQRRRDRRRILAEGKTAEALVTQVTPDARSLLEGL